MVQPKYYIPTTPNRFGIIHQFSFISLLYIFVYNNNASHIMMNWIFELLYIYIAAEASFLVPYTHIYLSVEICSASLKWYTHIYMLRLFRYKDVFWYRISRPYLYINSQEDFILFLPFVNSKTKKKIRKRMCGVGNKIQRMNDFYLIFPR